MTSYGVWRDKYPPKPDIPDAALWKDKYKQPLRSSSAYQASIAQPSRPKSVRRRRRRPTQYQRDASTVGSFDTLSYHDGARTIVMVHRNDIWCREHRKVLDPWVVGVFQRPDCRYLELRAKREAPRGLEVSLRISDRQINARAHPYDLQHWATRVLPFRRLVLSRPGPGPARLRLRRALLHISSTTSSSTRRRRPGDAERRHGRPIGSIQGPGRSPSSPSSACPSRRSSEEPLSSAAMLAAAAGGRVEEAHDVVVAQRGHGRRRTSSRGPRRGRPTPMPPMSVNTRPRPPRRPGRRRRRCPSRPHPGRPPRLHRSCPTLRPTFLVQVLAAPDQQGTRRRARDDRMRRDAAREQFVLEGVRFPDALQALAEVHRCQYAVGAGRHEYLVADRAQPRDVVRVRLR